MSQKNERGEIVPPPSVAGKMVIHLALQAKSREFRAYYLLSCPEASVDGEACCLGRVDQNIISIEQWSYDGPSHKNAKLFLADFKNNV